jgi:signal peptidase II
METVKRNIILLFTLVIIDQLLKFLVTAFKPHLDTGIFLIHEVKNTGASFGILQGQNISLIFVSLMALGVIMMNVKRIEKIQEAPIMLILAGIIGNLIDRMIHGYVIDYFDLGWFPVFNLADSCITIGVIWLMIMLMLEKEIIGEINHKGTGKNKRKKLAR